MCNDVMFWCVFEAVFGLGAAVISLLLVAAGLGFFDGTNKESDRG